MRTHVRPATKSDIALYTGAMPLPRGARIVGVVTRIETDEAGLLIEFVKSRLRVQFNAGLMRSL